MLARAPGCGAAQLALGGGFLYWTERATGNVNRILVANTGGAPVLLASGQAKPGPIAADETAAYWSNEGDLSISKVAHAWAGDGDSAHDGGAPAPLLTAPDVVKGLTASGGFLYYSAGSSTFRVASSGGASLTLATFATCKLSQPVALALDVDHVYQTDVLSQFITRERSDGTQLANDPCAAPDAGAPPIAVPDVVTHSQGELLLDAIGVSDGEVYWADNTTISAKPVNGTTTTSSRQVAFSLGGNVITGFVLGGGGFVYFGEGADFQGGPTANTIQTAFALFSEEAGTRDARVIAKGQPGAASFAAGAGRIYWTTHAPSGTAGAADDCTIVSLPQ